MRHAIRILTVVGLIGLGGVVAITTSLIPGPQTAQSEDPLKDDKAALAKEENPLAIPAKVVPVAQNPVAQPAEIPTAWQSFPYKKQLKAFRTLKTKVFLSEQDKENISGLLQHPGFTESLQAILQTRAENDEAQLAQNAAVDFLLDAVKNDPQGPAAQVLQAVVSDPSVESNTQSMDDRKALAGLKAEILFEWSAQDPSRAESIPGWLPGPVSQKIWANVLRQQENNVAESTLEMPR